MKNKRYAAIDIGSNAVRLLIKEYEGKENGDKPDLKKLMLLRVPLRLGFDVFVKEKVTQKKADNLLRLMKAYKLMMKIYDVDESRAVATSAMRDASNGKEIIEKIEDETGIRIEIIAGKEEAEIVYNNHLEQNPDSDGNYLYVDVGGGSTELNFMSQGNLVSSASFNIGTVRILSGKVKQEEWERLNRYLSEIASDYSDIKIIGSGGNINKLYRMAEYKDKSSNSFPVSELSSIYHTLKPLSTRQRMEIYGMKADRADVIIPAAEIFLNIASLTGADTIIVPVIGVADGIIDGLYLRDKKERDK